ncbi:MAG TPA: DNA internalization-related competence protein ComEC/Rec2, partial [Steroidobacteraceae bacterium]|nr:DNA internalization-related competence protein ComEC/Rec2 [Steroidobacteraceae bacterium]
AWLSFGAVIVILLATVGRPRRDHAIVNFIRVQWAVTLGLLPVLVLAFGSQSLISPIANAIAIPVFTLLIVPLVLFGCVVAAVWLQGGALVLGFAAQLLTWCWPLMSWLAERSWAMWYFPEMPLVYSALLAVAALLLVLPSVWPTRIAAATLIAPALFFRPPTPAAGDFALDLLDVGQGLAIVVRTHAHTLVYDAGPAFRTGRDTGELVVLPYLRARGVRYLDRLVISHGDLDHQGGMTSVYRGMRTRNLLVGPSVDDVPNSAERCVAGQRWTWDEVTFEVLHPTPETIGGDNDTSCVLRIGGRAGSALLTGDIEASAESALVTRGMSVADLVVVAHHGSRSSSTEEFVAATRPQLAIVSAGYRNRWGFPKTVITERWRSSGAAMFSTIESGAIEVSISQHGGIHVQEYRRERRRYWSSR